VRIREFARADWPQVWPVVREVIRAEDTFPYDPAMTSGQARDVRVVHPPGVTVVAVEGAGADERVVGTARGQTNRPGRGRVSLHVMCV
jgi:hypothetical protein